MRYIAISKREALKLIESSSKRSHSVHVAKIMLSLAKRLGKNEGEWELVGLVHDLDYDVVSSDMGKHGVVAAEMLEGRLSDNALEAIRTHDHRSGLRARSVLAKSLIAADALAIFIQDLRAEKAAIEIEILKDKLYGKSFSKPWLKKLILNCEELGLSLEEFPGLGLEQSE